MKSLISGATTGLMKRVRLVHDSPVIFPSTLFPLGNESASTMNKKMQRRILKTRWQKVRAYRHTLSDMSIFNVQLCVDTDPSQRDNAILFEGSPISHLPTSNLFAYATHFDSHPIALEWIDDKTCILVFSTRAAARTAYRHLTKSHTEEPSEEGYVTAKPIPIALWPPEERINKSLGTGEGLKGAIRMRWATSLDVKKRGAKQRSKFYRKYGNGAGREGHDVENAWESGRDQKRRRRDGGEDNEALERAQLDEELEAFLAEDAPAQPSLPPVESLSSRIGAKSKMRSDNMDEEEGRSLLERTSELRFHSAVRPRRGRGQGDGQYGSYNDRGDSSRRGQGRGRRGGGRNERPKVTQEDLDAELDAFLNSKD